MTPDQDRQCTATDQSDGRILLLGDDGRMEELLRRGLPECPVLAEADALDGVVRMGEGGYKIVLVNAERTERKTAEVVRALQRAEAGVRVLLYGQADAEVYAQPALRAGAEDCLIWPIPVAELRQHLVEQREAPEPAPVVSDNFTSVYRELAQLVPQGVAAVTARAEQVVPTMLAVQWVMIRAARSGDEQSPEAHGQIVGLRGPGGVAAHMAIGPSLSATGTDAATVEEVGGFVGTLVHLAQREERLNNLATMDELTGARNRRYLKDFVSRVIERQAIRDQKMTLLLFDVDDLKHYNDTYGHAAGDEILVEAAALMRRCCREHDVVARIGGDEFAVVFWDTGQRRERYQPQAGQETGGAENSEAGRGEWSHAEATVFLSNRFRRMLKTSEFPSLGPEARGVLTISGGMARFPQGGDSLTALLATADEALLNAKRSGKDRIYLVGQPGV